MIKADTKPYCVTDGSFWKYWIFGGTLYLLERILREFRGTYDTYVTKVIQHPSQVCEIQIKKDKIRPKSGQYIFLNCPEVSLWQYHPFTLTR